MKLLLTTIAAVLVVGCGPSTPDISILDAAGEGNIEAVKQHLAAGADVNAKDEVESTPLHIAAREGHKEIVELLIAKGADVNAKDKWGGAPLHHAITKEIAELLITNGADVNAKDHLGWTPLHGACSKGLKTVVELLIAGGADVNAIDDDEGMTQGMTQGMTPLHQAAAGGHKEIVELLIVKGADVNAKDWRGGTPLDWAGNKVTADLLRKHGGKTGAWLRSDESIHIAAVAGHIEAVKQHIAAGADVNAKMFSDETPLDDAIHLKHTEVADLLRKHGGKTGEELKAEQK